MHSIFSFLLPFVWKLSSIKIFNFIPDSWVSWFYFFKSWTIRNCIFCAERRSRNINDLNIFWRNINFLLFGNVSYGLRVWVEICVIQFDFFEYYVRCKHELIKALSTNRTLFLDIQVSIITCFTSNYFLTDPLAKWTFLLVHNHQCVLLVADTNALLQDEEHQVFVLLGEAVRW